MASETTLGDLKTLALDYAELTSGYIVDARLDDYANFALGRLHDLILRADPYYFKKEKDYTLVSNQETYALPNDFYKELAVYFISGSDRVPLQRFNPRVSIGYRSPNTTSTVRLWYCPQFKKLTADNDTIHPVIPISWEKFVALDMAQQCLLRSKLDPSHVVQQLQIEESRIVEMAQPRGWGDTEEVEDVTARFGPPYPINTQGIVYALVGLNLLIMREWPPLR